MPKATLASPTPARVRNITATPVKTKVPDDVVKLAAEFFRENAVMNAAKSKADKARKLLYGRMTELGLTTFDLQGKTADALNEAGQKVPGVPLPLVAEIKTPSGGVINCYKLRKLVPDDKFMLCISASKASVEEHVGSGIVAGCEETKEGNPNVSVSVRK